MTRVWGIDVSTYSYAITVIEGDDAPRLRSWTVLSAGTRDAADVRLTTLLDELMRYLRDTREEGYLPQVIGVEAGVQARNNPFTQWQISCAIAYVRAAAHIHGIPSVLVHNQKWKKHIVPATAEWTKKGRVAQKALVAEVIRHTFSSLDRDSITQDTLDATGIALYTWHQQKFPEPPPVKRKRKPRKPKTDGTES